MLGSAALRPLGKLVPHPVRAVLGVAREAFVGVRVVLATMTLVAEGAHPAWGVDDLDRVVAWAREVWLAEGQTAPLWVQVDDEVPPGELGLDLRHHGWGAARGRWDDGPPPHLRTGVLAGTSGPVARLIVAREPRCALVLHDLAHLLCDGVGRLEGHDAVWERRYAELLLAHVDEHAAVEWLRRLESVAPALPPRA